MIITFKDRSDDCSDLHFVFLGCHAKCLGKWVCLGSVLFQVRLSCTVYIHNTCRKQFLIGVHIYTVQYYNYIKLKALEKNQYFKSSSTKLIIINNEYHHLTFTLHSRLLVQDFYLKFRMFLLSNYGLMPHGNFYLKSEASIIPLVYRKFLQTFTTSHPGIFY